jgi:SAM-dependent methyltransferase
MKEFYEKVKTAQPRPLLKKSFEFISDDNLKKSYDLGCGVGQDTFALIGEGYFVTAVDISSDAFKYMNEKFGTNVNVNQIVSSLEDLKLEKCSLINASLVLPFVSPEHFDNVIEKIKSALVPDGLAILNFFGPKDDWKDKLVIKSTIEIEKYFESFTKLYYNEFEDDRPSAGGPVKHWHILEYIFKK